VIGPATTIVCVECGGTAWLIQPVQPDDELEVGDVVAYRCSECLDRFDLVVDEHDLEE
jgi:hypothetical protein